MEATSEQEINMEGQISIKTLGGNMGPNTMKFIGVVGKHETFILLDIGTTHTFIDTNVARQGGCNITLVPVIHISIAGEGTLVSQYIYKDFSWTIQGHTFKSPMTLIHLGG